MTVNVGSIVMWAAGSVRGALVLLAVLGRGPSLEARDGALGTLPEEVETAAVRAGAASLHVRLEQLVGGVPVLGSRIAVHLGHDGRVLLAEARIFRGLADPGPAAVPAEEAARAAVAATGTPGRLRAPPMPRLAILPEGDRARLVYECRVLPAAPPGSYRVLVDAATGGIIAVEDRRIFFDGVGRIFDPNPVVALRDRALRDEDDAAEAVPGAAYRIVALRDIEGGGMPRVPYTLTGPYVTTEGTPNRARAPDGRFIYDRSDPRFEEVMVYYHIDAIQRRLQSLGFEDVCRRRVQVFVNAQPPGIPVPADKSYYSPDGLGTGALAFGTGGVDSAEDAEIIAHEYGHAILDNQVPGFGTSREAVALAEGFCDFLAAAMYAQVSGGFGEACIGEWKATGSGRPCLRRLDTAKRYPCDLTYRDRYEDGEIWSGVLWDLAGAVGVDAALALAVEGNFYLEPDAGFAEAGEALLLADRELFAGTYGRAIEDVLRTRGILRPPARLLGFVLRDEGEGVAIPDDDPFGVESAIDFERDEPIRSALSLQVYLDIAHPYPPDLKVTLVSPAGTEVALTPPWCFPAVYGTAEVPVDGFGALVGEGAAGRWVVRAVDAAPREAGRLRVWGLRVRNIVRGEANGDGRIDLADAVAILAHLFAGRALPCRTRADANDDGAVDIADPVYLLGYLFAGGPAPPPPFQQPGCDPTPDDLACPVP